MLYEVFDADPPAHVVTKLRVKPILETGQGHFAAGEYAAAIKCFTDALMALPDDVTTRYYLKTASEFLLEGRSGPCEHVLFVGKE